MLVNTWEAKYIANGNVIPEMSEGKYNLLTIPTIHQQPGCHDHTS